MPLAVLTVMPPARFREDAIATSSIVDPCVMSAVAHGQEPTAPVVCVHKLDGDDHDSF